MKSMRADHPSRSLDTSIDAHEVQIDGLRRMGPEQRVRLAMDLSDGVRRIARDGVRHRHPDYTEAMVERAVATLYLGAELIEQMFPGEPRVAP
jgi:hypothetical protein